MNGKRTIWVKSLYIYICKWEGRECLQVHIGTRNAELVRRVLRDEMVNMTRIKHHGNR